MSAPPAYSVLIPARLASTRLPDKPLADLAGVPMVVRVARRAMRSQARSVTVATDSERIAQACAQHGVACCLTRANHPSGSDRIAEALGILKRPAEELIVNVQGDEPLIEPTLIDAVAHTLAAHPECGIATAAHPITQTADYLSPHVVKVVLDHAQRALYFSRAPIAWWRDGLQAEGHTPPDLRTAAPPLQPLRHIGLYAYRQSVLRAYPTWPACALEQTEMLEQLRALWRGERIAVFLTPHAPAPGVDTPQDLERVRQWLALNPEP